MGRTDKPDYIDRQMLEALQMEPCPLAVIFISLMAVAGLVT